MSECDTAESGPPDLIMVVIMVMMTTMVMVMMLLSRSPVSFKSTVARSHIAGTQKRLDGRQKNAQYTTRIAVVPAHASERHQRAVAYHLAPLPTN